MPFASTDQFFNYWIKLSIVDINHYFSIIKNWSLDKDIIYWDIFIDHTNEEHIKLLNSININSLIKNNDFLNISSTNIINQKLIQSDYVITNTIHLNINSKKDFITFFNTNKHKDFFYITQLFIHYNNDYDLLHYINLYTNLNDFQFKKIVLFKQGKIISKDEFIMKNLLLLIETSENKPLFYFNFKEQLMQHQFVGNEFIIKEGKIMIDTDLIPNIKL